LEECKPGEVDDGLFCRDTNPPGPGWVNDGLTFRNTNPPGPEWINDGLTFRKPIVTEVDDCPPGWNSDPLTCTKPIVTEVDDCPAGFRTDPLTCFKDLSCNSRWDGCCSRGLFGECYGCVRTDCSGPEARSRNPRTSGGEVISRNPRTFGGEVVSQEIRSQPSRAKEIKGRVNFDELLKEVDKGLVDLFSADGALARAFDPEKNGIGDAFRKFGDDMKRVLEEVGNKIKEGFDKMGAAAKAAFEEFARNAERDFKQFGDDFVAKMKDPNFWVEAIGIMAMIAGAALSLALTVGTLGLGAPAAAGIMAACSMAGPAAKMIAAAAKGEPIDALDIAQIVIAGATAAIPGMGPTVGALMKTGTTVASFAISAVQAGQGLGLIPSTCLANCPPPDTNTPDPPIDPPEPPSDDPPPAGQLSDEEILALAPPCTFYRVLGKPHFPAPCNTMTNDARPPYYSDKKWIEKYRAENYGTNPVGPGNVLTTPEDKAAADALKVTTPTGPEVNLGSPDEEDEPLDLEMDDEDEELDLELDDEDDEEFNVDEELDLELDELEEFPTLDEDEVPKLDLETGELDLDLEEDEDEELQPVEELEADNEELELDVEAAEEDVIEENTDEKDEENTDEKDEEATIEKKDEEELELDLEAAEDDVIEEEEEELVEERQQPINRPVFDPKAYEVPPPKVGVQAEAPNVEIRKKRLEDFALVKNVVKKIKKRLTNNSRRMTGGAQDSKSLTLYYADWCHFCTKLMPTWQKLRVPGIDIRMVEEQDNDEFDVEGYPTIIYRSGNQIEKYVGPRTKSGIEKFLKNKL
jgi:hypothetical protein